MKALSKAIVSAAFGSALLISSSASSQLFVSWAEWQRRADAACEAALTSGDIVALEAVARTYSNVSTACTALASTAAVPFSAGDGGAAFSSAVGGQPVGGNVSPVVGIPPQAPAAVGNPPEAPIIVESPSDTPVVETPPETPITGSLGFTPPAFGDGTLPGDTNNTPGHGGTVPGAEFGQSQSENASGGKAGGNGSPQSENASSNAGGKGSEKSGGASSNASGKGNGQSSNAGIQSEDSSANAESESEAETEG